MLFHYFTLFIFMKPLYTEEEFQKTRSRDKLPLECEGCGNVFYKMKRYIVDLKRKGAGSHCSLKCFGFYRRDRILLNCSNCHKEFTSYQSNITKSISGKSFCSKSCSATYNNTHKTKGIRRSKLEIWLEAQLKKLYPEQKILFNDKTIINSELDIYFCDLKLAFELNGIFHYEPIYGNDKLYQIQNNDNRKFQACLEQNIELCIIDTSKLTYFKEQTANKYLEIVKEIVNKKWQRVQDLNL
jgi:hypothetical protein